MKLLMDWGFSGESWKGQRGEYLLLLQAVLMIGFVLLPIVRPNWLELRPPLVYLAWAIAALLGSSGAALIIGGLGALGSNLTPLPHPRDEGELVQTGAYKIVRHPLYSGLTLAALGYAIGQLSLSHLLGAIVWLLFFDVKARREERWLSEKFPDYAAYQQRVKKLLPWLY